MLLKKNIFLFCLCFSDPPPVENGHQRRNQKCIHLWHRELFKSRQRWNVREIFPGILFMLLLEEQTSSNFIIPDQILNIGKKEDKNYSVDFFQNLLPKHIVIKTEEIQRIGKSREIWAGLGVTCLWS